MATRDNTKEAAVGLPPRLARRMREAAAVVLAFVALILLAALVSYSPDDPGWSHSGTGGGPVANVCGPVGAWVADIGFFLFGYLAYLFPLVLAYAAWLAFHERNTAGATWVEGLIRGTGFVLVVGAGTALADLHAHPQAQALPDGGGGVLGGIVGGYLLAAIGLLGSTLLLLALVLAGLNLLTGISWLTVMDGVGRMTLATAARVRELAIAAQDRWAGRRARAERSAARKTAKKVKKKVPPKIESPPKPPEPSKRAEKERQQPLFDALPDSPLPPLNLLDDPQPHGSGYTSEALEAMSRQVELKLADFGVEVQVEAVHPGPVITRFEVQPAPGVKSSQITNLAKDLARGLSVTSVRVVDVIPGKTTIGLEIPNQDRETVALSEVLRSKDYEQASSPLSLALGKDIGGEPIVVDLARMPHLLVAGTTGSGKSVAVNAMVLSLVYKATPEQVRMIMIDPKMLELSVYEGVPHLLAPVVTDMKDAANALRWCVAEMERRYRMMAALGVRSVNGFNRRVREAREQGKPLRDPLFNPDEADDPEAEAPLLEPLPYIVVVVDEFADMMMIVGKKVEELIARLAQKARASGIHLILATQRPSVDVITGLIKANIPTRIAFQVSSKVDSRTILDQSGAEQLLGHGDMLYLPPGTATTHRVHGAFVADHEVHKVAEYLKRYAEPDYLDEVLNDTQTIDGDRQVGKNGLPESSGGERDELYDQAVYIVTETRRASISGVQRRLKIGYNRAARMIEEMEAAGVVGPLQSNGSREVLAPPPPKD